MLQLLMRKHYVRSKFNGIDRIGKAIPGQECISDTASGINIVSVYINCFSLYS